MGSTSASSDSYGLGGAGGFLGASDQPLGCFDKASANLLFNLTSSNDRNKGSGEIGEWEIGEWEIGRSSLQSFKDSTVLSMLLNSVASCSPAKVVLLL